MTRQVISGGQLKNTPKISKGELVLKIQAYGAVCEKVGYEIADSENGHSQIDTALKSKKKNLLNELIEIITRTW